MTCFDAQASFRAMWRRELTSERRCELLHHLARCSTCDSAFRLFVLTAPVLHSQLSDPAARHRVGLSARKKVAAIRLTPHGRMSWPAICACVSLVTAAGLAVWMAITPRISLAEAIYNQPPVGELFGGGDMPPALSDIVR
jgi:hypothetical protein